MYLPFRRRDILNEATRVAREILREAETFAGMAEGDLGIIDIEEEENVGGREGVRPRADRRDRQLGEADRGRQDDVFHDPAPMRLGGMVAEEAAERGRRWAQIPWDRRDPFVVDPFPDEEEEEEEAGREVPGAAPRRDPNLPRHVRRPRAGRNQPRLDGIGWLQPPDNQF